MKLAILIVGLLCSTVVLLFSVLYQSDWGLMCSLLLQMLPVLVTSGELSEHRWFKPFWLAWSGGSFLAARWLQVSEGVQVNPVFVSFGPGYLIMAALAIVRPGLFRQEKSKG